jgi:hypothetical protein
MSDRACPFRLRADHPYGGFAWAQCEQRELIPFPEKRYFRWRKRKWSRAAQGLIDINVSTELSEHASLVEIAWGIGDSDDRTIYQA